MFMLKIQQSCAKWKTTHPAWGKMPSSLMKLKAGAGEALALNGCSLDDGDNDEYESEILYKAPFAFPEISRHEHCQTEIFETSDKFMELALVHYELRTAIVGEYYEQELRAEVRNEPDDDDYSFEYSSGLTGDIYFTADDKTFRISGYPDKKGLFEL